MNEWPDKGDETENNYLLMSRLTEFIKYQKVEYNDKKPIAYLADGSTIECEQWESKTDQDASYGDLHHWGTIWVDIDGPNKGKNKFGNDKFDFTITDNGVLPTTTPYRFDYFGLEGVAIDRGNGEYYATAWVIQNGNMDYLKASDGYVCSDSNIVLDWTTNSSCK